jgi:hypothetical protein
LYICAAIKPIAKLLTTNLKIIFMRKDYFKQVLLAAGLLTATTVSAVDLPYAKAPAEGKPTSW